VIVAVVGDDTAEVVTGKLAVLNPAGTETEAGTPAAELLLDRFTCAPPLGAAEARVMVPVALWPAESDAGAIARLPIVTSAPVGLVPDGLVPDGFVPLGFVPKPFGPGAIANDALPIAPPEFADMVALVVCATGIVRTVNSARVRPAGTKAVPATCAAGLFDASVTCVPPAGAGLANVTRPVTGPPAVCAFGVRATDNTLAEPPPSGSVYAVPLAEYCGFVAVIENPAGAPTLGAAKEKVPLL
jgi:hypothetical protein